MRLPSDNIPIDFTPSDKKGMMMPFIIFEFMSIALWIALEVLTVLVMAVYLTTSVDITTTVQAPCPHDVGADI